MKLEDAVHELPVARNAKKLKPLWPAIEAKLAAGVSYAEILSLLNGNGFDMSLGTFKTYLHRQRERQRAKPSCEIVASPRTVVAAPLEQYPSRSREAAKRPPTFEHDPKGNPDLLK